MKRIAVIALMLVFVLGQSGKAQDKEFRFTLKTNPLAAMGGPIWVLFIPVTGEYKVMFEARTTKHQSIETGLSFLGPSLFLNLDELSEGDTIDGVNTHGFRAQVMYKFFLTRDQLAPEGFYVGPHISYAKARIANRDNSDDEFTAAKLNANVLFGYQLITPGGFTLNVYTGLGFKLRDYDLPEDSSFDFDYGNRVTPNVAFGFTFGFAF